MNIEKALSSLKEDILREHEESISERRRLWEKYTSPEFIEEIVTKLENTLTHGPEDPSLEEKDRFSRCSYFTLCYPLPFDISEITKAQKNFARSYFVEGLLNEISSRMEKLQGKKRFKKGRILPYGNPHSSINKRCVEFSFHLEDKAPAKRYIYLNKILKEQKEQYLSERKEEELEEQQKQTKKDLKQKERENLTEDMRKNHDLIICNIVSLIIKDTQRIISNKNFYKEEAIFGNLVLEGPTIPIREMILKEIEPYISHIEEEDLKFDLGEEYEEKIYRELRDLLQEYGLEVCCGSVSYSLSVPIILKEKETKDETQN